MAVGSDAFCKLEIRHFVDCNSITEPETILQLQVKDVADP